MTHKMIRHDAKEFAGTFYEQSRSDTFRMNWPDQNEYVRKNWPHFVVHVRAAYADMLTRNDVTEEMKARIYEALIAEATHSHAPSATTQLQLAPGTQAFDGDRLENIKIDRSNEESGEMRKALNRALLRGASHRSFH